MILYLSYIRYRPRVKDGHNQVLGLFHGPIMEIFEMHLLQHRMDFHQTWQLKIYFDSNNLKNPRNYNSQVLQICLWCVALACWFPTKVAKRYGPRIKIVHTLGLCSCLCQDLKWEILKYISLTTE